MTSSSTTSSLGLTRWATLNPKVKITKFLYVNSTLDIVTAFSSAKNSLRNVVTAIKQQRGLGWDWEPAKGTLTNYFSACILLAYFEGLPEQSKGQKDGTVQGCRGRCLKLESIAEVVGDSTFYELTDLGRRGAHRNFP